MFVVKPIIVEAQGFPYSPELSVVKIYERWGH